MEKHNFKFGFLVLPLIITSCGGSDPSGGGSSNDYLKIKRVAGEIAATGKASEIDEGTDDRLVNFHDTYILNTAVELYRYSIYQEANNFFNAVFKSEINQSEMSYLLGLSFVVDSKTNTVDALNKTINPGETAPSYTWIHAEYNYETNTLGDYHFVTSTTYNHETSRTNATVFHRKNGKTRLSTPLIESMSSNPLFAGIKDDDEYDAIVSEFVSMTNKFDTDLASAPNSTINVNEKMTEEMGQMVNYIQAIYSAEVYFDKLGELTKDEVLAMLPKNYPYDYHSVYDVTTYTGDGSSDAQGYVRFPNFREGYWYPRTDVINSRDSKCSLVVDNNQLCLKIEYLQTDYYYSVKTFRLIKEVNSNYHQLHEYTYLSGDQHSMITKAQYDAAINKINAIHNGEAVRFNLVNRYNADEYNGVDAIQIKNKIARYTYEDDDPSVSYIRESELSSSDNVILKAFEEINTLFANKYETVLENGDFHFSSSYGEEEFDSEETVNTTGYRYGYQHENTSYYLIFNMEGDFIGLHIYTSNRDYSLKLVTDISIDEIETDPSKSQYHDYYSGYDDVGRYNTFTSNLAEFRNYFNATTPKEVTGVTIKKVDDWGSVKETESVNKTTNPTRFEELLNQYSLNDNNFYTYFSEDNLDLEFYIQDGGEYAGVQVHDPDNEIYEYPYRLDLNLRFTRIVLDHTFSLDITWF